jgi:hypothetical protein
LSNYRFPELNLSDWKDTRDIIQSHAELLSDIKSVYTPHQKNWEEHGLKIYAKGLTTTPIPVTINGGIETLDLNLNLIEHSLKIFCGSSRLSVSFENQSSLSFTKETIGKLRELGVDYRINEKDYSSENYGNYSKEKAAAYWTVLKQIYFVLLEFKGSLTEETSSINFWPDHFDIAMLWFSGRLVPGKDASDWDHSREQMNFGFSTGDDEIPEPYFYITAYPFNEELTKSELPHNAFWHTEGWKGAVLKYSGLAKTDNPNEVLISLFNKVLSLNKELISF